VVLHGDHERAGTWLVRWSAALDHGWGVLALQCPERRGCRSGIWYGWNGNPAWVIAQVDALAKRVAIDRKRVVLVGWSGGATYMGLHVPAWRRAFAALVFHGGGTPPESRRCSRTALPAYLLVGSDNHFHDEARRLRRYLKRCGSPTRWDFLGDADHDAEQVALDDDKVAEVLGWIDNQLRR
jgi:predicted esterase